MWVVYASICSSGSVDPSYRSRLKPFHLSGSGTSMMVLVKGCRQVESAVTVVRADLTRHDSSFISVSRGGTLSLAPSADPGLGGEVQDLPSFFFISSFSLRRTCSSCSIFWAVSSVFLFISAISLCRDNNNIVWSASVILSILLVETIYFLSLASFSWPHGGRQLFLLGRWDLENYWSLRLPPSVGQVAGCLTEILLIFALLLRLSVSGEHRIGGGGGYSDAQVSKAGDPYLGRCTVINDVPSSLGCVLFILF